MAFVALATARSRWVCLLGLSITIALGLATRAPAIDWPVFISDHAGDALWSVALYLALAWLLPRLPALPILITTIVISYSVEVSQLLNWQWLNALRSSGVGQLFLGTGFQWLDFPRYTVGAFFAFLIDRRCNAK